MGASKTKEQTVTQGYNKGIDIRFGSFSKDDEKMIKEFLKSKKPSVSIEKDQEVKDLGRKSQFYW